VEQGLDLEVDQHKVFQGTRNFEDMLGAVRGRNTEVLVTLAWQATEFAFNAPVLPKKGSEPILTEIRW
jgi:hypothetical protein